MHKLFEDSNIFLLRAQICYISVEELQRWEGNAALWSENFKWRG